MRHSLLILFTTVGLAGCGHVAPKSDLARGVEPVNVPVVSRQDFAFDAAAPDGQLSEIEAARLDGWFRGMDLGYGDSIYVEGGYGNPARGDVAKVAGRYGLLVSDGGPVLAGAIAPGMVRVVVSRARASVPDCPNWREQSEPNYNNRQMSNFGCGVNRNIAAMIANPEDLVHGREGTGLVDAQTSIKAIQAYRAAPPTSTKGLDNVSTKSN